MYDDVEDNPAGYASPTSMDADRKVAWSPNVDRSFNNSSASNDRAPQQQRVTGILRRDRRASSQSIENHSSSKEGTTTRINSVRGGDRRWSDGSRLSTGSTAQTGVSVRGHVADRGGIGEHEGGGDPPTAGRKSTCLFGSFCGICQRCRSKSQRQHQAPSQPQQQHMTRSGTSLRRNASQDSIPNNNATPPRKTFPQRIFFFLCCWAMFLKSCVTNPSKASISRMQYLARSRWWTILILIFTIIALFGPYAQDLWVPKEGDVVCDVLYTITFALFSMDILIRCYVTPNYWSWNVNLSFLCCCFAKICKIRKERSGSDIIAGSESSPKSGSAGRIKKKSPGSAGGASGSGSQTPDGKKRGDNLGGLFRSFAFKVGSFMFWCDFVSACTLSYDVSYINPVLRDMRVISVILGPFNIPISGILDSWQPISPELQFGLIVAIGRTARIARFIRASVVVKTSSKIDWYWIPDRLSPHYWKQRCCRRIFKEKKSRSSDEAETDLANGGAEKNNNEGGSDKPRRPSFITRAASTSSGNRLSSQDDGDTKAESLEDTVDIKKKSSFLQYLRFPHRFDKEIQKQHEAAIKIQRAFRVSRDPTYEGGYDAEKPNRNVSSTLRPYSKKSSFADQVKKSIMKSPLKSSDRRVDSHVGSAMRELTGQRVALGIMISLILAAVLTWVENDTTDTNAMNLLHNQTQNDQFADLSLDMAHRTSVPDMFKYQFVDGRIRYFDISGRQPDELRNREIRQITVTDSSGNSTIGWFTQRSDVVDNAIVQLAATFFIMFVWFFGVTAFAGPVMVLVVTPIERMIRLLTMLMRDPLGYQSTLRYKKFESEEDDFLKNTKWTKKVLEGMETSFLMSTILRIGNLMKVGFGSAGVEIIRNNLMLGKGQRLNLNTQGSTVSCVFLFCDIRQFTDATECLQEEVFVFTNKIAAVVHSICHSNGGSANKNVGDAFLLSWLLDDSRAMSAPHERDSSFVEPFSAGGSLLQRRISNEHRYSTSGADDDELHANNSQADKALLSVVKICIALYHDDYYTEDMSDGARERLLEKLKKRKGPVVQMGFGLHAGKAVQGAIGSQRKLDATYISESVEMSEYLESSTKKYGLKMLMSGDFYKLLHPTVKRRCRKIDQILIHNQDDDASDAGTIDEKDVMNLFTYDMDIDALWKTDSNPQRGDQTETASDSEASARPTMVPGDMGTKRSRRNMMDGKSTNDRKSFGRRVSMMAMGLATNHNTRDDPADAINRSGKDMNASVSMSGGQGPGLGGAGGMPGSPSGGDNNNGQQFIPRKPVLPTGPVQYNIDVWGSKELKDIRKRYAFGNFFPKFSSGLQSYYARDWEHARQCFQTILERFDDGPSRYFLNIIKENNGIPPRNFTGYGAA